MGSRAGTRIPVPSPSPKPAPHPFPLMATIAPVALSVVIFFVTKSPFALVFAALGPVVAIASVVDARLQAHRRARGETRRFARELARSRNQVAAAHDAERRDLDLDFPSARARLTRGDHDPERFAAVVADAHVTLGRGAVASGVEIESTSTHGDEAASLRDLSSFASTLGDAPVTTAAQFGIAVVGAPAPAGSVARGYLVQLAAQLSPASHDVVVADEPADQHWMRGLPHRLVVDRGLPRDTVAFRARGTGELALVTVAERVDLVTSRASVVVTTGSRSAVVTHPDRDRLGPVDVEFVSREQCRAWAARLVALAETAAAHTVAGPPDSVVFASLSSPSAPSDRSSLVGVIGVGGEGEQEVDLVRDGPHAIVGGTTGSGKSELLISWVLSMAWRYTPEHLTFLLVDFKGGASFASLEALEHCVGVMSDLDERAALRALESLKAEVRFRERTIAEAGVRSIDRLPPETALPRLVIVVDEFAAMVADFPDLHTLFADLAARGRSLGLHLVLCTQRPAGVVRDAVLANAGLRISLRVNNPADSVAVIGTDAAAAIPATPLGRALVASSGEPPVAVQVPLADDLDARRVADRWPRREERPRRPWCEPLPSRVVLDTITASADGMVFGLADHPYEQSQPAAEWRPALDGHVLVVGAGRTGKSTFLRVVADSAGDSADVIAADEPDSAWDAVAQLAARIRGSVVVVRETILLLDDVDAVLSRFSDEHATAFLDLLAQVLRDGPSRRVFAALTVQRLLPAMHATAALCGCRLVLRMPNRQEHVLVGANGAEFDERAVPGRGTWHGHSVQVAMAERSLPARTASVAELRLSPGSALAVVASNPAALADRLRSAGVVTTPLDGSPPGSGLAIGAGAAPTALIGDPDAWQSRWGALQTVLASTRVYLEGCSLADYRVLTRSRELPPPLVSSAADGILLEPDGRVCRARLVLPSGA